MKIVFAVILAFIIIPAASGAENPVDRWISDLCAASGVEYDGAAKTCADPVEKEDYGLVRTSYGQEAYVCEDYLPSLPADCKDGVAKLAAPAPEYRCEDYLPMGCKENPAGG